MSDNSEKIVYIIDDDISVGKSLSMLLNSADMNVKVFDLAEEFLKCTLQYENSCLISDIEMKGISGFDLQKELVSRGIKIPMIFLTASYSEENRHRAKKSGAVGYLSKPVDDQALLDTIYWAMTSFDSNQIKR